MPTSRPIVITQGQGSIARATVSFSFADALRDRSATGDNVEDALRALMAKLDAQLELQAEEARRAEAKRAKLEQALAEVQDASFRAFQDRKRGMRSGRAATREVWNEVWNGEE